MGLLKAIVKVFHFNRTNWKAVFLCLMAAVVFWLFNALNKTYSTNIRFPLAFEYDRENFMPASALPTHVTLNVSGLGWDLSRKHFGLKVPELSVPVDRPLDVHKIPGSSLTPVLGSQLGALEINFVVTDTLVINLDAATSRQLPIHADLSAVRFREGFGRVGNIVIEPDTIQVEGPRSIVERLPDVLYVTPRASRLDEPWAQDVEAMVPHNDFIKRSPPMVKVSFPVGRVRELEVRVPLAVEGIRKSKSTPDSVTIRLEVDVNASAGDLSRQIQAKANGNSGWVTPELIGLPGWARLTHIDSVNLNRNP
jgi:hypothetical protein